MKRREFLKSATALAASSAITAPAVFSPAKAQSRAGLLMGLESVQSRCDHLARQIQVQGRIVPVAETVAQIEAVDLAMARRAGADAIGGGIATASVGGKLARVA